MFSLGEGKALRKQDNAVVLLASLCTLGDGSLGSNLSIANAWDGDSVANT